MLIDHLTIEGIKTREVKEKPRILISKYFEDKARLRGIVREQGILTREICDPWPRDLFVYWQQKLLTIEHFPDAGEQGNYVFGEDYCLASGNAFAEGDLFSSEPCGDWMEDEFADRKLLSEFFGIPVYEIETPLLDRSTGASEHIDLFALCLPETRKLLVEQKLYASAKETFDELSSKQHVELIPFDSQAESLSFPYNCLVLPGDFVVANSRTPRFLGLLREIGVSYATVEDRTSPKQGGSIRCRTHYIPSFKLVAHLPAIQNLRRLDEMDYDEDEEYY